MIFENNVNSVDKSCERGVNMFRVGFTSFLEMSDESLRKFNKEWDEYQENGRIVENSLVDEAIKVYKEYYGGKWDMMLGFDLVMVYGNRFPSGRIWREGYGYIQQL